MASSPDIEETKKRVMASLRFFPFKGLPNFVDIMPIFQDPTIFTSLLQVLEYQIRETIGSDIDAVVGLESRGFLFGPSLALRLNCAFVPVRKTGGLPGECVTIAYTTEYSEDSFQMQKGALRQGQKVLIVDDILATGGSASAAADLVKQLAGGQDALKGFLFLVEVGQLNGRQKLGGLPVITLLEQ